MSHPVLQAGNTAVITGGASGIGLACAQRFAALGMAVCIADLGQARLERAVQDIIALVPDAQPRLLTVATDVRKREDLEHLESLVTKRFGGTDVLMNNAAISGRGDVLGSHDYWQDILATNLWGVIHGAQVFVPNMIARGRAGLVISTGSKQGITTPPGNPAYNVAKAGVKAFTEALQHQLRNTPECRISAHLLIPGFVFTGLSQNPGGPKPAGAWTPQQLVEFMMTALSEGDFYILCPDNDVSRELDEKRILWAAGDLVENRPPLSRWHPDYQDAFKSFVAAPLPKKSPHIAGR
jgi:NAD(P)-dependent dehydrogenase (short-subunit alcohol dehydrogenase family)